MPRRAPIRRALRFTAAGLVLAYGLLTVGRLLYPIDHLSALVHWSEVHGVDPALTASVIRCESRFRPRAVSPQGAIGLMQIMPSTGEWIAERLGHDGYDVDQLYNPEVNVRFGTWYLAQLIDRFDTVDDALRAYNAGPTHAERWAEDPAGVFPETAAYVERVRRSLPVYRAVLRVAWLYRLAPAIRV